MWSVEEGKAERTAVDAAALARVAKHAQSEAMVYAVALLLAAPDFATYRSSGRGDRHVVRSARGEEAEVLLMDGAVQAVEYRRPAFGVRSTRADAPAGDERASITVRVTPGSFKKTAAGNLPHSLRFDYGDQGSEQVTIRSITLNPQIPASEFEPALDDRR